MSQRAKRAQGQSGLRKGSGGRKTVRATKGKKSEIKKKERIKDASDSKNLLESMRTELPDLFDPTKLTKPVDTVEVLSSISVVT